MPTKPVPELLPRTREPNVQAFLDTLADNLDEVVNFGTRVFQWQNDASVGRTDEVIPVALIFRHMLGMIDAVAILIRGSSVVPAQVCLRSVFEASVQLHWLLQRDSKRRGMAFMVWHVHHKLKLYKKFNSNTQQGKELSTQLADTVFDDIDVSFSSDLEAAHDALESVLQTPKYQEAEKEYQRLRSNGERNPKWYRFFGGKRRLEKLAAAVDMQMWYQIMYRKWSGVAHATDVVTGVISSKNDETRILQLRYPRGVEDVYSFSVSLSLKTFRLLMDAFDPPKLNEIASWYREEIQSIYSEVSSRNIIEEEDT